jgi:hypothetical protein
MKELPNLSASLLGIVLSSAYVWQARAIEDSLLSDEVGAGGVPAGVGLLMLAASIALLLKALVARARAHRQASAPASADDAGEGAGEAAAHPHRMALGLLAILAAYVALLPWVGYIVSMGLLAAGVALFAGARMAPVLVAFAVAIGPLLWFLFEYLLQVRMPAGAWSALFGG